MVTADPHVQSQHGDEGDFRPGAAPVMARALSGRVLTLFEDAPCAHEQLPDSPLSGWRSRSQEIACGSLFHQHAPAPYSIVNLDWDISLAHETSAS